MKPQSFVNVCIWVGLLGLLLLTSTDGQDAPGFRAVAGNPPAPGLARQAEIEEGVTLIMCVTDLRKTLLLDSSGRLIVDARSLTVDIPRFGEAPTATCKMYLGVFEPTGAVKKSWAIREIRLVDEPDFQKLVDQGSTALRVDSSASQNLNPAFPANPPAAADTPAKPPANQVDRTGTIPLGPLKN